MAKTDTTAITGLRGLAAVHVMIFHYVGAYTWGAVDLNGALQVSTFFLLSGFCLTLKYGRSEVTTERSWRSVKFLQTRLSRFLPLYYVANVIGYFGRYKILMPLASPTWTMSTLLAFYLVYPVILPCLQSHSSSTLTCLVPLLHHVQCLPYILFITTAENGRVEHFATSHPLHRLPVFLMGVSAGLLALREVEDPHHHRPLLHDVFPWSLSASISLRPASTSSEASWARRTDRNSVLLLSLVLYNVVRLDGDRDLVVPSLPDIHIVCQLFSPHCQLVVMVGLTRDGGKSWLSAVCRSLVCQSVGRYSMAIYMLHVPVLYCLVLRAGLLQDEPLQMFLCVLLTLLISVLLSHVVERPLYNFCRPQGKPTTSSAPQQL